MITLSNAQLRELQDHLNAIQGIISHARINVSDDSASMAIPNRAMSKAALAAMAGVAPRTFAKWLHPFREELRRMGVKDTAKVLPANAVSFICTRLVITPDDKK